MRLIDADNLKKEIQHLGNANPIYWNKCDVVYRQEVLDEIDSAETIIPFASVETQTMIEYERPQGEWVIDNWGMYHCNYCMKEKQQLFNNFCSFCGADMRGNKQ